MKAESSHGGVALASSGISQALLPYDHHSELAQGEPMAKTKSIGKQYLYIMQATQETASCKIGITNDLERRLAEYNSTTGKSKNNQCAYLYTCETKNMKAIEKDLAETFGHLREESKREMYFYNTKLFGQYVDFIETHTSFKCRVSLKKEAPQKVIKIVKKTTPTLGERGMTFQSVMNRAQRVDNDEFYTRYEDVEKELSMYDKRVWENKTVFCNCDDAVGKDENSTSAFAMYFIKHFKTLKLKKLICTHYSGQVDLFGQGAAGYIFTKTGFKAIGKYERPKDYNGSFDHPLSIEILENEADIVCTNPPFSRGVDYWNLVVNSGKKFLIISNISNIVTKSYIGFFKNGKAWPGHNRVDSYSNSKRQLVEAGGHWYTNLKIKSRDRHRLLKIVPLKQIPDKYIKYDDSGTLLVDQGYIPSNYKKPFGVSARPILNGVLELGYELVEAGEYYPYIEGQKKFARVLIRKQKG
ncbi:MAG: GIY-YIG nuclease family protein [Holophagaceae bacterium]|nr:GIY-YIG nuclease family protein [Holophagaceae bacterium]